MLHHAQNKQLKQFSGKTVRRIEDPPSLTGTTCYVDDIQFVNPAYLGVVRSTYAHARVRSIDVSEARNQKGVLAIHTSHQLSEFVRPIPPVSCPPGQRARTIVPFALGKVRYVGEPVAVVVAESKYLAEDAVDSIIIDYEPLEPVVDTEQALTTNTVINEEWGNNVVLHFEIKGGDAETAFRQADTVIKNKFAIQRYSGASMEPRAVAASYDIHTNYLTVWSSTQWPHVLRTFIATALGIPENRIHTIAPDVGGGFGNKEDVYPEDILVPLLSKLLARPIKWSASRSEDLKTTVHAREQTHYLELAGSASGKMLALKDRIIADLGAFHILSSGPPMVSAFTFPGPYDIRNVMVSLDCVTTNKTAEGAYRGFGMPESTFVLERGIDLFAEEIGMDPAEVRLLNLPRPSEFPYKTVTGSVYDSGNYPKCLRKALDLSNYKEMLRYRQKAISKEKVIGIGISFYNEAGSFAPARFMYESGCRNYSGWDTTTVRITPTGKAIVLVGVSAHGQGHKTTFAQVCAEELQIDIDDVTVLHGDSNTSPYGFGTWGTRSTVAVASMVRAIRRLKKKMKRIAAHMMGVKGDEDLVFGDGLFTARSSGKSVTLQEVAKLAYQGYPLPAGMEPGLEETSHYDPPALTYSYATNLVQVELDNETCRITFQKYFIVHDCGKMVNPSIVEGQIVGGLAQGIGGALLEEFKYDSDGQLVSSSFMDYLLPTSLDIPKQVVIDHMVTPSPHNDGYKGMSEGGCIGAPAAIANAVDDALRQIGAGIATMTPLTEEYVWRLLKSVRMSEARSGVKMQVASKL